MISPGELPTSQAIIYTVPVTSNIQTFNLFRIVNESGAPRTFTIFLKNDGNSPRAICPVDTQLRTGAAYDDFAPFQLRKGGTIQAVADAAGVSYSVNVENVS